MSTLQDFPPKLFCFETGSPVAQAGLNEDVAEDDFEVDEPLASPSCVLGSWMSATTTIFMLGIKKVFS